MFDFWSGPRACTPAKQVEKAHGGAFSTTLLECGATYCDRSIPQWVLWRMPGRGFLMSGWSVVVQARRALASSQPDAGNRGRKQEHAGHRRPSPNPQRAVPWRFSGGMAQGCSGCPLLRQGMVDGNRVRHDRDNACLCRCGNQHHDRWRLHFTRLQQAEEAARASAMATRPKPGWRLPA